MIPEKESRVYVETNINPWYGTQDIRKCDASILVYLLPRYYNVTSERLSTLVSWRILKYLKTKSTDVYTSNITSIVKNESPIEINRMRSSEKGIVG